MTAHAMLGQSITLSDSTMGCGQSFQGCARIPRWPTEGLTRVELQRKAAAVRDEPLCRYIEA
jgi:hypothetical protein